MRQLGGVDLLDNASSIAHQVHHVPHQPDIQVFRGFRFAIPECDQPHFIDAAGQRRIQCPAIVALMDIVAFLG